jgi:hypothetical protein
MGLGGLAITAFVFMLACLLSTGLGQVMVELRDLRA